MNQFQQQVRGIPSWTLIMVALLLVLSALSMISVNVRHHFALVPGNTLMGEHTIWNIFTGNLVETNVLKLMLTTAYIIHFGSLVEQKKGFKYFALYSVVICIVCGVVTSFATYALYIVSGDPTFLFEDVYGASGVCMALAIAIIQLDPDHSLPGIEQLTHKSLVPIVYVMAFLFEYLLEINEDFAFVNISLVTSWLYLRFFEPRHGQGRGDRREEFAFLQLLPQYLRPVFRPFELLLSKLCLHFSCFRDEPYFFAEEDEQAQPLTSATAPSVASTLKDPVAQRRRDRALKALDEKFNQMKARMGGAKSGVTTASTAASAAAAVPPASPTVAATTNEADNDHKGSQQNDASSQGDSDNVEV